MKRCWLLSPCQASLAIFPCMFNEVSTKHTSKVTGSTLI